jgi:hypothetical protein
MTKRYDICAPRKSKDGRTFWTRIGTAFESDKGIQLIFDALPLPDAEGRCVANLFEPRERDAGGTAPRKAEPVGAFETDYTDDVPFATANPALEHRIG